MRKHTIYFQCSKMEILSILEATLSSVVTFGITLLVLLATFVYFSSRRPKNFPPGPPAYPIIGSLPYISTDPNENINSFREMHEKIWKYHWDEDGKNVSTLNVVVDLVGFFLDQRGRRCQAIF